MGLQIIMIGVQGAGKGTQALYLAERFGIPHISTGDLFRAMKTLDTPLAREVQALMRDGKLIPDDITNQLVEDRLAEADAQAGAIFDGYPRTTQQAETLDALLSARGDRVNAVLVLELDHETAIKRAEGRRYSQDKQRVYNIYFNPPQQKVDGEWVDDEDGQPLFQREDDHLEAVEKRIATYYQETAPLIDYYRQKGLVIEIDASRSIEQVREEIFSAVESAR